MQRLIPVGLFAITLLLSGCESNDPKVKMRNSAKRYNEGADLIATVKDAKSFEAARPKLKTFLAWVREQEKETTQQSNSNRMPTDAEMKKAFDEAGKVMNSPEFKELMQATGRYMGEVMRAQMAVKEFRDFYQQEMPASSSGYPGR